MNRNARLALLTCLFATFPLGCLDETARVGSNDLRSRSRDTATGAGGSSGPASPSTSSAGGQDPKAVPLCDNGALSSEQLQPGVEGGPGAKKSTKCVAGYSLCRVDPKGPDNDVCSEPTDCFACSKAASGTGTSGNKSCDAAGGDCLSSPMDVTFPANCEKDYGRKTLSATCSAINQTCCAKLNGDEACAAAGGECLSDPGDPGFAALCEQSYGTKTLDVACSVFNKACCAKKK